MDTTYPRPHLPAIETTNIGFSVESPTSAPGSSNLPSFRVSLSPNPSRASDSPSDGWSHSPRKPKVNSRARNESRKLFAHVLGQLERRPMPPLVFDAFSGVEVESAEIGFGTLVDTVKDVVRSKGKQRERKPHVSDVMFAADDDSDDDSEWIFSTDATYDLMMQLKDVLIMSVAQGWHIFDDGSLLEKGSDMKAEPISSFRRSRNSLQPGGRRSRSPSPAQGKQVQAPELLSSSISVLASVVLEDCRYKISSPRPSRPPNALQALSLDIAQFLLHAHRHDPQIISRIGFAMIPAFSTFQPEMYTRLLAFFEEGVIRGILCDLGQIQGIDPKPTHDPSQESKQDRNLDTEDSFVVSIQVDEVHDNSSPDATGSKWSLWSSSVGLKLKSTNAPLQSLSVYYLASLVPPLLAEILERIDLIRSETRPEVLHRLYQLLHLIVDNKIDSYTDFLQVIGYHTPKARRSAASLLVEFWPKAIGHLIISKPFLNQEVTISPYTQKMSHHSHDHQFTPWRFTSKPNRPSFHGFSHHDCHSCSNAIQGFGLLCPFCMCVIHFDCYDYPGGSHLVQYAMISDQSVQRVAMYRFSSVSHNPKNMKLSSNQLDQHTFRTVSLFTLCLCIICRRPLWGCTMQALNCVSCMCFVHSSCLSSEPASNLPPCSRTKISSEHMNIDWANLRNSCIDFHQDILRLSKEELSQLSYEDISIFYASMWIQSQILTNGIALGAIVVSPHGRNVTHAKEYKVATFELHRVIAWCEDLLSSNTFQCSDSMDDYIHENRLLRSEHSMVFDWSNLVYISTAIKSQLAVKQVTHSSSSDLLNVYQPDAQVGNASDTSSQPFEVIPLGHMRDALGHDFNIHSDVAARLILSHLHNLGLFVRLDHGSTLFANEEAKETLCIFPLPLGLDLSTNVETLVSAVEACLSDLDLSVNEVGFLLLVRRLWPNGLASDYASRRLTRMVLSWILQEDNTLPVILRDYIAKQKTLPGVRSSHEPLLWPSAQTSRPAPSSFANNGGDYIATRRALLSRYVIPWLLALHDQDTNMYAKLVYDVCLDLEDSIPLGDTFDLHLDQNKQKEQLSARCDKVLRSIIRLSQASIIFTVFDQLFVFWLESTSALDIYKEPMPSLPRIFPRDAEMPHRSGTNLDQMEVQGGSFGSLMIDPWRSVVRVSGESREGLSRGLRWLCLLSRSGVEVPVTVFTLFSTFVTEHGSTPDSLLLVKAVMFSTWLQSVGRQELQNVCSQLHDRLAPIIKAQFTNSEEALQSKTFIRVSLGTCLLLYGCDRGKIMELGMIKESDIKGLPPRRKFNVRGSMVVDPIIIDPRLMNALEYYMTIDDDEISSFVGKFLNLFLNDSPYLEPYEVDNFILRNGKCMAIWAWEFYHVQRHKIASIRTSFLLRTLVVDSQPFQEVLHSCFLPGGDWQRRLLCVTRLFRIMLDVISPSFNVEGRQWRSSVTVIFYYFFNSMWADEREEIRVAANAFSSTLLPAHFDAISLCWNEFLNKAPIDERTKLISFLIQLRPYFPVWKVLSWDAIVEALVEDDYDKNGNGEGHVPTNLSFNGVTLNNKAQTSADSDTSILRVSLLLLSLQMIADGIAIDSFTLLKLKIHLVQVTGFNSVSAIPSQGGHSFYVQFGEAKEIPELALPCISSLLPVLDAYHHIDLSPSAMAGANGHDDRPLSVLVGSIFVDVSLALFCTVRDLSSLPLLTLKSILETLCVVIYKHDFESRVLRHLQQTLRRAVLRALDILSQDTSYEIRQLALSVTQAFIKRWHGFMGSIIYTSIESVAKLFASQHHHGQDALTSQAKLFIETTLTTYAQNGLFINLLKRQLDQDFFSVLKHVTTPGSLHEFLLRDGLSRAVDSDHHALQLVLNNIDRFVEVVFHRDYSAELLLFVGQQLTHIVRKTSDLSPDVIDPSPLLSVCARLIQHNKANCREMLPYVDTIMRVVLNRLCVTTKSLSHLIQATTGLLRKHQSNEAPTANGVVPLIFEMLSDGLRMKARILPFTIRSMLEAITTTDIPGSLPANIRYLPPLHGLLDHGIHFLQNHAWLDVGSENDFTASLAVGKLIFQLAGQDPLVITKVSDYGVEKSAHTNLSVRAWNILALTALLETKEDWCSMLFTHLSSFSYAYHAVLRPYAHLGQFPNTGESSTADINHAFIGIKLWIMLSQKASGTTNPNPFSVWNELWPPFEGLIDVFEPDIRAGQSLALGTLITSSIADLFIFLRTLHTPIALHTSNHLSTLNRLRSLGQGEATMLKVTRSLRYMLEPPPDMSFDVLVHQTTKDIVAAEKLRVLENRVTQDRRALPERHRQTRTTA